MSGDRGSQTGGPPRIAYDTQVVLFAGVPHQVVAVTVDRERGEAVLRLRALRRRDDQ